jgi:hypothetical protein
MTMMSEMAIGEIPMETSFVGASAAPSHAPAVKPERMPSSCNLRARAESVAGRELAGGADIGMKSGFENQCMNRRSNNPPASTTTGTQKWMSISMLAIQFWVCGCESSTPIVHPRESRIRAAAG